ncbi:MAG TPA: hypothetical protein P5169_03325, partial [Kiritimatiellia bacterium]|nr:hypothetical protein [Kiritimatiellia bacterium]
MFEWFLSWFYCCFYRRMVHTALQWDREQMPGFTPQNPTRLKSSSPQKSRMERAFLRSPARSFLKSDNDMGRFVPFDLHS